MTSRMDIWRSAKLLVERHGGDAPIRAAQQADERLAALYAGLRYEDAPLRGRMVERFGELGPGARLV